MTAPPRPREGDPVAVAWALAGTALVLLVPAARLGARAAGVLAEAGPAHLCAFALIATVMVSTEGHLALHRKFVPSVHRRAVALGAAVGLGLRVIAPLYAMSLIGAPRAMLRAWAGATAIVAAALLVRQIPEPWRAIIDGGVACALSYGAGSALAALVADVRKGRAGLPRMTSTTKRFGRFPG